MIPFNVAPFPESAFGFIRDAHRRRHLSGDGHYTKLCEKWIEQRLGTHRALLTTSCSTALEMAMLLLDVGPGDEVIVPSFTFVSCANAVVLRGATPIFADIDEVTLSISPSTIEKCLSERTRAVMLVNYAGTSRDAAAIAELCCSRNIELIEDTAHAFLAKEGDQFLGTFGSIAALSFHETKNFSMGEGGALLLSSEKLAARAEILREKGTNRKQFFQGLVDKYTWVDLGSSYLPSEILAAVLWAQFLEAEQIQGQRQAVWDAYSVGLADWASAENVQLPVIPEGCTPSFHMFQLLAPSNTVRDRLLAHLRSAGIGAVFHYLPLEQSPFAARFEQAPCPVSTSVSGRLLRLPLFADMPSEHVHQILTATLAFRT